MRQDKGLLLLRAAAGVAGLLLLVAAQVRQGPHATALYSTSHSEVATFRSVWNSPQQGSVLYPGSDGQSVERPDPNEPLAGASLCGIDGSACPELPAFNGEDYFDEKPLGCCNTPEQQAVWTKWTALKNRVAGLEATVRYLQGLRNEVNLDYTLDEAEALRGAQGPAGLAGPQGPVGGLGAPGPLGPQGLPGAQGAMGGPGARGQGGMRGLDRHQYQQQYQQQGQQQYQQQGQQQYQQQGALAAHRTPILRAVQMGRAVRRGRDAPRRSVGTFQDQEDAHVPLPLA